jgi:CubicO group peptidase (beta-lactamase class C family)
VVDEVTAPRNPFQERPPMRRISHPSRWLPPTWLLLATTSSALHAQGREPYPGLEKYVQRALAEWCVPGAAIAIVRNDSLIYAKGFGVREIGRPDPVDAQTIFAIGSNSKAFTAAAVEMLVDDGKVNLDAPVSKYLPGFRLSDPIASEQVVVRDLLGHRTGVARSEWAWYGSSFTRDELVRNLRFLPMAAPFRTRFQYNNITYVAAGQVVAHASGRTWDDFLRTRIFAPLGMTSTGTSISDLSSASDVAWPHAATGHGVRVIPRYDGDNVGAAGSINSNAVDMAQWLRLHLAGGMHNGKRILSERGVEEMRTAQMVIPTGGASRIMFPNAHLIAYGLGFMLSDYAGKLLVEHNGEIDGMTSAVAMVPEADFGVVVMTNMAGVMTSSALVRRVVDLELRLPTRDWSRELKARADSLDAVMRATEAMAASQRVPNTKPTLPLSAYAGTYADSAYGELTVTEQNGTLSFARAPIWRGTLEHWHYDTFRSAPLSPLLPSVTLHFRVGANGKVANVEFDAGTAGGGTLRRVASPPGLARQ